MCVNELKNKNVIIFGSSKAGKDLYKILTEMSINVKCFVDNDKNKWSTFLFDKFIMDPGILYYIDKDNDFIIIGSMYVNEISNQLNEMGLKGLYVDMFCFIDYLIINNPMYRKSNLDKKRLLEKSNKYKYLLILPRGLVTGGAELWALKTYSLLLEKKREVVLISLSNKGEENLIVHPEKRYEVIELATEKTNFFTRLEILINGIIKLLPSTLITTNSYEIYLACRIIKKETNQNIKLISVIHSDVEIAYIQNERYADIIDKFICVSDEIRDKLVKILNHREKDIYTFIAPIMAVEYIRSYSNENEPIKLGYAGRLVKSYKRADYIIKLIDVLESKGINYQLSIAGIGEYAQVISEYITIKRLEKKVTFLGGIPNHLIYEFWREQDVFINVSDVEGACISMYEGMYNGAVPIVTKVAGAKKFVEHGENGFIVDIGDIDSMAEYIKYLYENRNLLEVFGKKSSQRVFYLCNPDNFINDLIDICEAD